MKNKILLFTLFAFLSITTKAQDTQWYAIFTMSTNTMLQNFDCNTHKQVSFVSNPILMPNRDEVMKGRLSDQFYDWLYNNEKDKLDEIVGLTRMYQRYIVFGKSPEEAIENAKKYGAYSTKGRCDKIKTVYNDFGDFKFNPDKKIPNERITFLREYIDPKE
ncbi:hypothetical protein [Meridianimaribacter flavus]|uniref:Uncharacterized protein n=1 Tax=Meridianimaribacter flavus TaxID=571115 RepID=A0ABY2G8Y3_9FLAO|nr:hypothetical protein [Meridianimaribacter flavus]TDY13830.1 hypothetical protein A8975_0426 [Meridianimaribacter flavus]